MYYWIMPSPVGPLLIAGDESALYRIEFPKDGLPSQPAPGWAEALEGAVAETVHQLKEYFAGTRREFDLPLAPKGTPFQRSVWRSLEEEVPYGDTISYGELARRVGKPRAARAVGSANGANQLPIVIPCHRVIAGDGSLGGFGGNLEIKRKLLVLEGGAQRWGDVKAAHGA